MYCPLFKFCFFMAVNTHKQTEKQSINKNQCNLGSRMIKFKNAGLWAPQKISLGSGLHSQKGIRAPVSKMIGLRAPKQGSRDPPLRPWYRPCKGESPPGLPSYDATLRGSRKKRKGISMERVTGSGVCQSAYFIGNVLFKSTKTESSRIELSGNGVSLKLGTRNQTSGVRDSLRHVPTPTEAILGSKRKFVGHEARNLVMIWHRFLFSTNISGSSSVASNI